MNYRSWLRKQPAPVVVAIGDKKLNVAGESRTKWADIEASLLAIARDGDTISALDADGVILRSVVFDSERADEEPAPTNASATGEANADFMVLLAQKLNEAHDAGAKRHADAYVASFNVLASLVEMSIDRLSKAETMYAKMVQITARAQADSILAQAEAQAAVTAAQNDSAGGFGSVLAPLAEAAAGRFLGPATPPKAEDKK
jgi:hypothetical protein